MDTIFLSDFHRMSSKDSGEFLNFCLDLLILSMRSLFNSSSARGVMATLISFRANSGSSSKFLKWSGRFLMSSSIVMVVIFLLHFIQLISNVRKKIKFKYLKNLVLTNRLSIRLYPHFLSPRSKAKSHGSNFCTKTKVLEISASQSFRWDIEDIYPSSKLRLDSKDLFSSLLNEGSVRE